MNKQPDRNTGDMAAQTAGSDPETSGGQPQIPPTTSSVAKTSEKNPFSIGGGTASTILPSAASIQLAQLQAQLTLQRLKFAQSAVNSNTAAASVLSQVLTKVAMSQPLFNSLIGATSAPAGGCMPSPAIPPAGLAYPAQTPALTALQMNPFVGMTSQSPAHSASPANLSKPASSQSSSAFPEYPADFSCKTSAASNHTYMHDEVLPTQGFHPFGFSGDIPNILPANHGPVKGPQLLSQPHPGFQMDFQNSPASRMQALGYLGEMSAGGFPQVQPSANPQNQGNWTPDQWQNLQPNRPEFAAQPQDMWPSKGQQLPMRNELYNPEEPTSEGKSMVRLNRPSNCNQNVRGPLFNPRDRPPPGSLPERQIQLRELNDFHGLVPSQLPHICSICDKKVFNLKDWEHHVKGKHHIQNCTIFSESSEIGSSNFTRPPDGGVNSCGTSTVLTPSDFPLDNSQSHLRMYPSLSHGFSSQLPGSKLFSQRKPGPSRVVHICNLPDGSCTESDVINLGLPFGKVTNYILMRATNQAFLEMAYPEAAQAMVQFYQQKPPAIGEQQLLVRMSKQYKELKLKKPGKNVDSIINDINSQKEREMQKSLDRFPPERPRSRSPFMQSLSPKMESHSPSLTSSCSSQRSSLSPRKGSMSPMLVAKGEWSNGLEKRGSRDYHFHKRRNEEKSETILKNYSGDESDKRGFDRRQYLKLGGRCSPQLMEDSGDGYQGYKDKYAKSGLQNLIPTHSKYKMQDVEDYKKEHKLKSVRRHHSSRTKEKGRDVHRWSGKRTSSSHQDQTEHEDESEGPISPARTDAILTAQEEKGRSKHDETSDSEVDEENSQCCMKRCSSPRSSRLPEPETERSTKEQSTSSESGSETEGEAWYSGSLEEFVTVDEVGGEEEHLMEVQQEASEIQESDHIQNEQDGKMEASIDNLIVKETVIDCGHPSENLQNSSPPDPRSMSPTPSLGSDHLNMESDNHSELVSNSMNEMQQIADEELQRPVDYQSCETGKLLTENESIDIENQCRPIESCENDANQQQEHSSSEVAEPPRPEQSLATISIRSPETAEIQKQYPEGISRENLSQPMQEPAGRNQQPPHIQQTPLPWKHNNVFSNLSIPLGVEFVEARTGFYCKLCGLFYITEEAAKTSHCRSPVHYKNLQGDLGLLGIHTWTPYHSYPFPADTYYHWNFKSSNYIYIKCAVYEPEIRLPTDILETKNAMEPVQRKYQTPNSKRKQ